MNEGNHPGRPWEANPNNLILDNYNQNMVDPVRNGGTNSGEQSSSVDEYEETELVIDLGNDVEMVDKEN